MQNKAYIFLPLIIFSFSCTAPLVEITAIDQKTALENQVLGSYKELSNDVILLGSVRSVDESGKLVPVPKIPDGKKKVISALQRRDFNKDDIEIFKKTGVCGEDNLGLLQFLETVKTKSNLKYKTFVKSILNEENEDRLIVMNRIVDTNENFKEGDLSKVKKIFAGLYRDNAKTGEILQNDEGEWVKKN